MKNHPIAPVYGLTKRELFVAMALQGLTANPKLLQMLDGGHIAPLAVAYANALLDELERANEDK